MTTQAQSDEAGTGTIEGETTGLRRCRPGPGTAMAAPRMAVGTLTCDDRALDRHITALEDAARRDGPLTRTALAESSGARWWGPGPFRLALREGLEEGRRQAAGRGRCPVPGDAARPDPG